jgi:hypothetical protein
MHDRPRVIIAGDSYSDPTWQGTGENWVTWLSNKLNVTCIAMSGFSNWDIAQTLKRNTADIILCSLTSHSRISQHPKIRNHSMNLVESEWDAITDLQDLELAKQYVASQPDPLKIRERNKKIAQQLITQYPHVYFWSPFPEYEHLSGVSWIPLERDNEMYASVTCTGCHLSYRGNEWLFNHMKQVIEARLDQLLLL